MTIKNLPERLHRLKNYAKHSPAQLLGMSMATVAAATLNIALAPGIGAYALFMATGIGLAAVSSHADINNGLTSPYGGLFKSKRRGKQAMLLALREMQKLEFPDPAKTFQYVLKVFNGFQRNLSDPTRFQPISEIDLPCGYVFKGILPDVPKEACDVLVNHAIYLTLTKGALQPSRDEYLSAKLQRHILGNYPEWVAFGPFLFDPELVQDVHPGMYDALVCIRALEYTGNEQSAAIRSWLDSQTKNNKPTASLPDSLVV